MDKEVNEYASWSIALRSMIKNQETFQDYKIGLDYKNNALKLSKWLNIHNNYFITPDALNVDFKKTFKNVDLGGGDQKKF